MPWPQQHRYIADPQIGTDVAEKVELPRLTNIGNSGQRRLLHLKGQGAKGRSNGSQWEIKRGCPPTDPINMIVPNQIDANSEIEGIDITEKLVT